MLQGAGYVEPTVVEFFCDAPHLDIECFFSSRPETAGLEEPDDTFLQTLGRYAEQSPVHLLSLSGNKVEEVEAEYLKLL